MFGSGIAGPGLICVLRGLFNRRPEKNTTAVWTAPLLSRQRCYCMDSEGVGWIVGKDGSRSGRKKSSLNKDAVKVAAGFEVAVHIKMQVMS